ncbi:MAG: response regulator [Nitrospiraceae bacterium]|nr:response regulator [Nitrospiraceae bacterium]MDA8103874.1 response regulator [Nitrospiraceae bacterium]
MALILVIEDSSFMRNKIGNILKRGGHEIIEAEDGIKGLQMTIERSPDCILLDLIMPGMDGVKLLMTLRERGVMPPVVIVTADIQESTIKQCRELGAAAVVNKPPGEEELLNTVRNVLRTGKDKG